MVANAPVLDDDSPGNGFCITGMRSVGGSVEEVSWSNAARIVTKLAPATPNMNMAHIYRQCGQSTVPSPNIAALSPDTAVEQVAPPQ